MKMKEIGRMWTDRSSSVGKVGIDRLRFGSVMVSRLDGGPTSG